MIRKPTEQDFREGMAVTVLRETGKASVASARGVRIGYSKLVRYYLAGILALGLGSAVLSNMSGSLSSLVVFGLLGTGATIWYRRQKSVVLPQHVREFSVDGVSGNAQREHRTISLDRSLIFQKVFSLLIPAVISAFLGFALPIVFVVSSAMFAFAVMLGARAFGKLDLLHFDDRSVRVTGLLGTGEMLWTDVADVKMAKASRFNLTTIFTSGSRSNIVIIAPLSRIGGPRRLFVPIDLIDRDHDELLGLLTDMLRCCNYPATVRDLGSVPPAATPVDVYIRPSEVGDHETFNPDRIMERYLADRNQVAASGPYPPSGASSPVTARRAFGRKVA